jgi:hypothetical protein
MKLKKIFFFFLLAITTSCYSQTQSNVRDITKFNFLNPGVSYEKSVNKNQTLFFNGFINPFFTFTVSGSLGNSSSILFEPSFNTQYRFYYNSINREKKGQTTTFNNLNYVAPVYEIFYTKRNFLANYVSETKARSVNKIGVVWGLQRNYAKRFSLDINIGLGYLFTKGTTIDNIGNLVKTNINQATLLGHLNLGFWLNKK